MTARSERSPLDHPKGKQQTDGTWLRNVPSNFALKVAVAFGLLDAAVLLTVPTSRRLLIERVFWEITTGFTGGTSSAIGISADTAPNNTKGDILGGASGDVAAALVVGLKGGTIGAKFGSNGVVVLEPGVKVRFDRITSAFTAGAGYVHLCGRVLD